MISVKPEAIHQTIRKTLAQKAAAIGVLLSAIYPAAPAVAADPPASNSGAAQIAQVPPIPAYEPRVYNSPVYILDEVFGIYNAPIARPRLDYPGFYSMPGDGSGPYFGPTGSASFMRDSDLIKRFEPRSTNSLVAMPRSTTGSSTVWQLGSGSRDTSNWISTSDAWRLNPEGGSKKKVLTSSIGYDVGARAGYQFGNFRLESQFDYTSNSVDTFENPRRVTDFIMRDRDVSGSTTSKAFLINGFLDVKVPYVSGFGATPYFGGGIGAGETSLNLKVGDRTIVNDSDWGLAYQLGAGVKWQVTPNLSLDIGYRYRGITDVTLHNEFEKIIVPNRSHHFEVSLLYNLPPLWGAATPATPYVPPPPPPPPPPRPALPVM